MRTRQKINRLSAGLVLGAAMLAAPTAANAGAAGSEKHVVREGQSIQEAVDDASPGDTIVVTSGTYHESVVIQKNGISLRARGNVRLMPPEDGSGLCNSEESQEGICVIPADLTPDFTYTNRVSDVTITGFRVRDFQGDGILAFGTEDLTVTRVRATDNTSYGIASFDGLRTTFKHNRASGSEDAGLYVGDSPPNANSVISHNLTRDNALGILLRHTHHVVATHNRARGNCLGVLLLDDGQATGSGENAVLDNRFTANNEECPQFVEILGSAPAGGGIVAAGSQQNVIAHNLVRSNRGDTPYSGGIVLVATPVASEDGSFSASTHNVVIGNRLRDNRPADIVQDEDSSPNFIAHNNCRTSRPPGLCR
ncbi:MAG TPA: right-handed parallel beta-helix repeat-containing protein [Nocardioides sp.]|nr:right-handed parallel beta-helix repeat-containing protein [Nocardioides sp.]